MCLITLTKNWHEFEIASSLQNLVMVLRPGYKGANFDCLAPRPECGAGGVVRGLGEGAKAGAPAFHLTRKEWRPPNRAAILIMGRRACLLPSQLRYGEVTARKLNRIKRQIDQNRARRTRHAQPKLI